ncbi:5' nucleotidase, NT5C type [Paenibacillus sp. y28]|uniref:5' nucleotidase, NT5C type n=1 Tax=Paenibacillus sp. y28 TaxID=3129110 RepID=UPI00301A23D5
MKKPIIAVDMDDTICHLVKRAIYHNNNEFPTHPLRYEDMFDWNTDHLRHPDSTHEVFFGRPGLYEELELLDDDVVGEMEKLHAAYDVIIVTAAEPRTVVEKWNWLQKHMPFIPFNNFFTCRRKNLIEFDLLIDDGPHNLIPAQEEGKKVLCIPHPWNLKAREQYGFPIMAAWEGAKERIDQILRTTG